MSDVYQHAQAMIKNVQYFNVGKALEALENTPKDEIGEHTYNATVAVVTLHNGMVFLGKSHCHDSAEYVQSIGEAGALRQAMVDICVLASFNLRQTVPEDEAVETKVGRGMTNPQCSIPDEVPNYNRGRPTAKGLKHVTPRSRPFNEYPTLYTSNTHPLLIPRMADLIADDTRIINAEILSDDPIIVRRSPGVADFTVFGIKARYEYDSNNQSLRGKHLFKLVDILKLVEGHFATNFEPPKTPLVGGVTLRLKGSVDKFVGESLEEVADAWYRAIKTSPSLKGKLTPRNPQEERLPFTLTTRCDDRPGKPEYRTVSNSGVVYISKHGFPHQMITPIEKFLNVTKLAAHQNATIDFSKYLSKDVTRNSSASLIEGALREGCFYVDENTLPKDAIIQHAKEMFTDKDATFIAKALDSLFKNDTTEDGVSGVFDYPNDGPLVHYYIKTTTSIKPTQITKYLFEGVCKHLPPSLDHLEYNRAPIYLNIYRTDKTHLINRGINLTRLLAAQGDIYPAQTLHDANGVEFVIYGEWILTLSAVHLKAVLTELQSVLDAVGYKLTALFTDPAKIEVVLDSVTYEDENRINVEDFNPLARLILTALKGTHHTLETTTDLKLPCTQQLFTKYYIKQYLL